MIVAIALTLLFLAFFSTLRAVTASTTERLLWGSLLASTCLGLAVQLRDGGYYGLLMIAVFIVTDIIVYMFFRSLKLLPERPARNQRADRAYRVFVLWLSLCAVAGVILMAFVHTNESLWLVPNGTAIGLLYSRVWAGDWLLVALPVLGSVVLVTGGFFLVRREP